LTRLGSGFFSGLRVYKSNQTYLKGSVSDQVRIQTRPIERPRVPLSPSLYVWPWLLAWQLH